MRGALVLFVLLAVDEAVRLHAGEHLGHRRGPHVHLVCQVALDDAVVVGDDLQQPGNFPVVAVIVPLPVGDAEELAAEAVEFGIEFHGFFA